ncbi:hypothetical protein F2P81_002830 [Scophthalmus maximus]|uniref:Uncharacterized protein n=1 Tax=Scophthalmus maximus TaxID=52904 RepID=A0A6A4TUD7_SCOMX|nr:hypothetical protein F2P81_002830 [Scophthalmus maximus]
MRLSRVKIKLIKSIMKLEDPELNCPEAWNVCQSSTGRSTSVTEFTGNLLRSFSSCGQTTFFSDVVLTFNPLLKVSVTFFTSQNYISSSSGCETFSRQNQFQVDPDNKTCSQRSAVVAASDGLDRRPAVAAGFPTPPLSLRSLGSASSRIYSVSPQTLTFQLLISVYAERRSSFTKRVQVQTFSV